MKPIEYYFVDRYEKRFPLGKIFIGIIMIIFGFYSTTIDLSGTDLGEIMNTITLLYFIMGIGTIASGFFFNKTQISGIIEEEKIFSMSNRQEKEGGGSFFLGIGSVSFDEQEYYIYYRKGDYGLIKEKLAVDEVEVIMTNKVPPSKRDIIIEGEQKTFLFVPKNTIKKRITLTT